MHIHTCPHTHEHTQWAVDTHCPMDGTTFQAHEYAKSLACIRFILGDHFDLILLLKHEKRAESQAYSEISGITECQGRSPSSVSLVLLPPLWVSQTQSQLLTEQTTTGTSSALCSHAVQLWPFPEAVRKLGFWKLTGWPRSQPNPSWEQSGWKWAPRGTHSRQADRVWKFNKPEFKVHGSDWLLNER